MEKLICPSCKNEYQKKLDLCKKCQFPFNGTEKEKAIHIGQFIKKKEIITDSLNAIEVSRKFLLAIAVFNIVFLIIGFKNGNIYPIDLILNTIIALTFALCGIFIQKNPILLTIIPLLLIVGIYLRNYIIEPASLFKGIIYKLAIIGSLIYSVYLVVNAEKFKKNLITE